MVAVIDYDAGNIKSVEKALQYLGEQVKVTREREEILSADRVILPGVGAFGDAMSKIRGYGLERVIWEVLEKKIPFLGICLGLQLLFEESEESKGVTGLGILKGRIVRISDQAGLKIPHIGWNSLSFPKKGKLFAGIEENTYVYFVHSYYLQAGEPDMVTAVTEYGGLMDVSVEKDNLYACQFHPEKSSGAGLRILKNFMEVKGGEER